MFVWIFFACSVLGVVTVNGQWESSKEKQIRTNIFAGYDRLTRPKEQTVVNIALNLLTINDLDIKAQTISLTGWVTMEWEDERLTWDKTASATESEVAFALPTEIWWPEVFVDNSMASVDIINNANLQFRINSTGQIDWEVPRIFVTSCTVDISYFPFDTQRCSVQIVSWAYTKTEMKLVHLRNDINIEDYQEHGEFIYKGSTVSTAELTETKSSGLVEKFSQLTFTMTLERRPNYYVTSIILPVSLTQYLMVLVFVLPVDSGEKIGYSLTVLLALAVLLTLILDNMPSTALFTSYLSVYLSTVLILSCICVILSVCIIRLHFRNPDRRIPKWMNNVVVFCARISLWNGCKHPKDTNVVDAEPSGNDNAEKTSTTDDRHFTWPEIAAIFDWFCFVFMILLTTIMLIIFMVILRVGGNKQSA